LVYSGLLSVFDYFFSFLSSLSVSAFSFSFLFFTHSLQSNENGDKKEEAKTLQIDK